MRGRLVLALALLLFPALAVPVWAREARQLSRSVCLLKSPQGSGSGFFARWEGRDVLVTNNHVILEMADVKILDINGRAYRFDTVYASPKRDLAIIPLVRDNLADMPNLPLHPAPDHLAAKSPVTAYGDSLGDGVIVGTSGKYLGIGPDVLEVDAPFVPGNSGGPVVADRTGEVIGVATYCRIISSPRAVTTGSRFEAKRLKPSVRRFATRLDSLRLDDFEKVNQDQIRQDQAAYRPIAEVYDALLKMYDFYQAQSYLAKHAPAMPDRWHTTYLRQEAYRKYKILNELRKILLPGRAEAIPQDSELYHHIRTAWRNELPNVTVKNRPELTRKCFLCKGYGKMRVDLSKTELNENRMQASFRMEPCSLCGSTGKLTIRPAVKYAVPSTNFLQQLRKEIKPEDKPFCGFKVGRPFPNMEKMHHGFYRNGRFVRTGVYTIWRYNGNHQIREAAETRLWLVGDLLLRADVLIPVKDEAEAQSIIDGLRREYPVLGNAELQCSRQAAVDKDFTLPAKFTASDNDSRLAGNSRNTVGVTYPPRSFGNGRESLAIRYRSQLVEAAQNDPFAMFFPVRTFSVRASSEKQKAQFLQVTFQHKAFDTCMSLIDMPADRGFSFSGEAR